ncbi:capsular biosynthesis protein [Pedobacter yulinensis]|uniref:Capsular biosynthesis protein n=1 Tax=Pedobacter yulinensis TaxID=2126353 RepID=A0A2T3HLC1_9SPHI|nr:DegT/DnrJ/EryC1/StrS family aminotransferase [Pedobacter yulinensis]PST83258.1 capsular biosynthesis protein [Pedobacter yulinensis]
MNISFSPPFIDQQVIDEVLDTLHTNWITSGPKVKALEDELMAITGSPAAICVNSWTSGAIMALNWFGVGPGDEVIVPAYSYCATALCVLHCGATPVMVDILDDLTINPEAVLARITPRTKAIIAVDIAGLPCHYNRLNELIHAKDVRDLFVPASVKQADLGRILLISDAAHSIGASYQGRPAALMSDMTIFSFHAVKNVTTGEGGCICLNLPAGFDVATESRYLKMLSLNGQSKDAFTKSQGGSWRYDILFKGFKMNMPDICAAIGLAQLRQYTAVLLPMRKKIYHKYLSAFMAQDWFIPPVYADGIRESSCHLFALRIRGISEEVRDELIAELALSGIQANVHFIPMPMLTYFESLGYQIADYPESRRQFAWEISLPIYPQLRDEETDFVIDCVLDAVNAKIGSVEVPALTD